MGLFEKVKNMFTEEVEDDDDVKVEQIKKEVTHVAIESPNALDDSKVDIEYESEEKTSKPIFFDDNDFKDLNLVEEEPRLPKFEEREKEEEKEIYGSRIQLEKKEEPKKIFKPTPIISPVYGVLDKNYHKEDIVSRSEVTPKEVKPSPIDEVRNKAYGTLEDELEDTLFGSNSILFKKEDKKEKEEVKEVEEDVLTNLTDDISKKLDEILVKKEKYDDEDVKDNLNEEDLLGFIDSTLYKDGDE